MASSSISLIVEWEACHRALVICKYDTSRTQGIFRGNWQTASTRSKITTSSNLVFMNGTSSLNCDLIWIWGILLDHEVLVYDVPQLSKVYFGHWRPTTGKNFRSRELCFWSRVSGWNMAALRQSDCEYFSLRPSSVLASACLQNAIFGLPAAANNFFIFRWWFNYKRIDCLIPWRPLSINPPRNWCALEYYWRGE